MSDPSLKDLYDSVRALTLLVSSESREASLAGLLHLGEMAVLITAAYLGIDRFSLEDGVMDTATKSVKNLLDDWTTRLDISVYVKEGNATVLNPLLREHAAVVLLYVRRDKTPGVTKGFMVANFLYRQRYVPYLNYFRNQIHKRVVGILCFLSTAAFLLLVGSLGSNYNPVENGYVFAAAYALFSISILWVFKSLVIFHYLLRNILGNVEKLAALVEKHVEKYIAAARPKHRGP